MIKLWLKENRYTSHQAVNDLIDIMGQTLLRNLLSKIRVQNPAWYSVIVDEATDVCFTEQLNISIRWVNDEYEANEDAIGLFRMPDTKAETLFTVIKDLLTRCSLPLELCCGQAYDGAANMQGKRSGVAARFLEENPAAVPVHCFAHSLNLCLQGIGRNILCLRDALDVVREISKLIKLSPKRLHLFSSKIKESDDEAAVSLKSLCTTRWTARTAAFDAILKDYSVLLEVLEDIYETTKDEYGLKASGLLQSLGKFDTLFGLMLSFRLFSASEQVLFTVQTKNIAIYDAISAIEAAKEHFKSLRTDEEFSRLYAKAKSFAEEKGIGQPVLPRKRKRPLRYESGSEPYTSPSPTVHYRKIYFEACDLLLGELQHRFEAKHIPAILSMERALIKAANNEDFKCEVRKIEESCYSKDIDFTALSRQLELLHGVMKTALPLVKSVTSIHTICDALNNNTSFKGLLPCVHHLIRLALTVPIASATAERTFSSLQLVYTPLRSRMTEKRLNNCLLLHVHKELTDAMDLTSVAQEFVGQYDEQKKYFGNY